MSVLGALSLLSVLGGLVATTLMWSHDHPHSLWSLWSLMDLGAFGLMAAGLRYVDRKLATAPAETRLSSVLAEPTRMR
ncbi:hypothetical protein [Saccharopolyspora sp. 5N708]|uniref:hypothetical protein n=1 Tax=Saccharopolyspora sp. 5N708 TaxID=3457424 RepID=UPI003FD42646